MSKEIRLDKKELEQAVRLYLISKGIKPTNVVIRSAGGPCHYGYSDSFLNAIYGEEEPDKVDEVRPNTICPKCRGWFHHMSITIKHKSNYEGIPVYIFDCPLCKREISSLDCDGNEF